MLRHQTPDDRNDATHLRAALEHIVRHPSASVLAALGNRSMRFTELVNDLPAITQDALNANLRELDRDGLVSRRVDPGPPLRVLYELTQAGTTLVPVLGALLEWTQRI